MKNRDKITIIGVPASPYTRKMLAVLRFKNIDYSVIWGNPNQILNSMGLKVPKPTLLPVMILNKNEKPLSETFTGLKCMLQWFRICFI